MRSTRTRSARPGGRRWAGRRRCGTPARPARRPARCRSNAYTSCSSGWRRCGIAEPSSGHSQRPCGRRAREQHGPLGACGAVSGRRRLLGRLCSGGPQAGQQHKLLQRPRPNRPDSVRCPLRLRRLRLFLWCAVLPVRRPLCCAAAAALPSCAACAWQPCPLSRPAPPPARRLDQRPGLPLLQLRRCRPFRREAGGCIGPALLLCLCPALDRHVAHEQRRLCGRVRWHRSVAGGGRGAMQHPARGPGLVWRAVQASRAGGTPRGQAGRGGMSRSAAAASLPSALSALPALSPPVLLGGLMCLAADLQAPLLAAAWSQGQLGSTCCSCATACPAGGSVACITRN